MIHAHKMVARGARSRISRVSTADKAQTPFFCSRSQPVHEDGAK